MFSALDAMFFIAIALWADEATSAAAMLVAMASLTHPRRGIRTTIKTNKKTRIWE